MFRCIYLSVFDVQWGYKNGLIFLIIPRLRCAYVNKSEDITFCRVIFYFMPVNRWSTEQFDTRPVRNMFDRVGCSGLVRCSKSVILQWWRSNSTACQQHMLGMLRRFGASAEATRLSCIPPLQSFGFVASMRFRQASDEKPKCFSRCARIRYSFVRVKIKTYGLIFFRI